MNVVLNLHRMLELDMDVKESIYRHIISAFHPEAGEYSVGDKCHKLRYLIIIVNDASGNTFYLGPRSAFDEGHITTFRRFCYVRQYNKDKP